MFVRTLCPSLSPVMVSLLRVYPNPMSGCSWAPAALVQWELGAFVLPYQHNVEKELLELQSLALKKDLQMYKDRIESILKQMEEVAAERDQVMARPSQGLVSPELSSTVSDTLLSRSAARHC